MSSDEIYRVYVDIDDKNETFDIPHLERDPDWVDKELFTLEEARLFKIQLKKTYPESDFIILNGRELQNYYASKIF